MATAWTRLWRRAPAWRFCLVGAIATTGLAAMFPPTAPDWLPNWRPAWRIGGHAAGGGASAAGNDPAAHFAAQPDPAPLDYSSFQYPSLGRTRSGVIPFAGRRVPLPPGAWQELAIDRGGGKLQIDVEMLARIEDGRLTGLLLPSAPGVPGTVSGPVELPSACIAQGMIAHHIAPPSPDDLPSSHECWSLAPADLTEGPWRVGQNSLSRRGLDRVALLHALVPEHVLKLTFFRSNDSGGLEVVFLIPDERATSPQQIARLQEWAARYATEMNKGFSGTAPLGELPRDPR